MLPRQVPVYDTKPQSLPSYDSRCCRGNNISLLAVLGVGLCLPIILSQIGLRIIVNEKITRCNLYNFVYKKMHLSIIDLVIT